MEILRIIQAHRVIEPEVTGADYLRRVHAQIEVAQGSADGSVERHLAVTKAIGNAALFLECPSTRLGDLTQVLDAIRTEDPAGFPTFDLIFRYTEAIRKVDEPGYVSALRVALQPR